MPGFPAAHAEMLEAEAVVVRRIFEAYVKQDLTVRQIAKRLTLDRTSTPRKGGGQWSWSAVDRILHEEGYIGTYYYNCKQCVPIEGVYGKKRQPFKCTLRTKEEWIPISVPPIIDLATFHAAAGRARENEAFSPRNLQEGGYLVRNVVRCGRCGCSCSALTSKQTYGGKVHSNHYYGCLRTTSGIFPLKFHLSPPYSPSAVEANSYWFKKAHPGGLTAMLDAIPLALREMKKARNSPALTSYLPSVGARIAVELRNQYVLGYSAQNRAKDGNYRHVEVKLDNRTVFRYSKRTGGSATMLRLND